MSTPTPTVWPNVRKSATMLALEGKHGNTDIRNILIDALVEALTDKEAARVLGIDNTTLSNWLVRLRIDNHASIIRAERAGV